jgi:glycosyltransferase involved in cell wall biosynthesis
MTKIALITESVYPYFVGGQEKTIYDYAEILAHAGDQVTIVTPQQWAGERIMAKNGVVYEGVCRHMPIYKRDGKRNSFASIWLGLKIFVWALRSDDDVLFITVFPYFPLLFARLACLFKRKKPVIVGLWAEYWGAPYWKKYSRYLFWCGMMLENMSFWACDEILAISQFTKKKLDGAFGVDKKKIMVLAPTYIDTDTINSVSEQEKKYDMIYYGRIIAHKRVEHIVHMTKKLVTKGHMPHVLIIGEGPDRTHIQNLIEENALTDHIEIIDFVEEYTDLIKLIKSSRIMVQPSEREGFGITVAESNACGLPVLVMDYPDNAAKELVADTINGYVCKTEDELSEKVSLLLYTEKSVDLMRQMSQHATLSAQEYSYGVMKEKVVRYFSDIGSRRHT